MKNNFGVTLKDDRKILFHVSQITPIGSLIHYRVDKDLFKVDDRLGFNESTVAAWRELDGKTFKVVDFVTFVDVNVIGTETSRSYVVVEEEKIMVANNG